MSTAIGRIIRRGWLFLANLSLEKKLILVFVFLLSLPITYVSYLSARSTFNSVLQNATNNAGQMADNASDTIDRYVDDLKRYTALPLYNKDVQYYLGQEHTDWYKNESMGMFLSYLSHTKKMSWLSTSLTGTIIFFMTRTGTSTICRPKISFPAGRSS